MQSDLSPKQRLFKPLQHQQGVWTKERLQQLNPLYPSIPAPFSTSSQDTSTTPSNRDDPYQQSSPHYYTYQELTTRLHTLQTDFNNSPYHHTHQQQQINTHSKRLNINLSSSSISSASSHLSLIKPTFFHDYTFSQDHFPQPKHRPTSSPNIDPSPPSIPPIPSTTKEPTRSTSSTFLSSQDDDSILCTKEERQQNLPFGNVINTAKTDNHSRILFQNINNLEMLTC